MLLLCLDTSTPTVTVALVEDGAVRGESTEVDARRHGELLAPAVTRVLAESGVGPSSLGAVAVGVGPGPFTGLRVGLVTAATLADALGIPAYGACSLDLVSTDRSGSYAVATDARRREVYWAVYSGQSRVDGPYVDRPDVVAERLRATGVPRVLGAGARLHADAFRDLFDPAAPDHPRAAALWDRVAERAVAGAPGDPLTPLYLRRPDAAEPARPKPVSQPAGSP